MNSAAVMQHAIEVNIDNEDCYDEISSLEAQIFRSTDNEAENANEDNEVVNINLPGSYVKPMIPPEAGYYYY